MCSVMTSCLWQILRYRSTIRDSLQKRYLVATCARVLEELDLSLCKVACTSPVGRANKRC